ncbi:PREDICTED: peptidyl-prolyl cis-trans isomerase FKBP16-3, chloroplastic isoform X2 [Nelumbo nucifera]|uniref:peptidylprolyl isomerase n=2 Tax=Nelumbo nucifera TaxID=4432 RepID=A0A1U8APW9_NELNU|nr:PREDICTED: peptidyl-prolyl cis-trans isomerase FKBP16-3, chloroplastic isoform X2 [Nelumbo nucifera]DAD25341.1 TPA_asm: hypothetical protein HUJ06_026805 [Nelumbo nucifera]
MASSSLLLPLGCVSAKRPFPNYQTIVPHRGKCLRVLCTTLKDREKTQGSREYGNYSSPIKRRDILGFAFGISGLLSSLDAKAAGLPPEQKPRLCDDACEKELENVAANYVAMVSSGQIFDSSLEKGQPYIFRVGSGQVIKGLDEGILSMKIGGKRRLYIPGPLAFPKGLNSAPGRPRVAPNSPVIFDVSLEYIPGLEVDEE